jgi:hypothetical protein
MKASEIKVSGREICPPEYSYADAIHDKNEARHRQRNLIQAGNVNPRSAQARASLFHGVQSRVIRYGQGAAI